MSVYLRKEMIAPAAPRNSTAHSTSLIGRLILGVKQRWQRRKMVIALQELDDRLLADIGLRRGDIPSLVAGLSSRELRMAPVAQGQLATEPKGNTYLQAA